MEALDPIIQTLAKDAVGWAAILLILRWGLVKVDEMIGSLKEALEQASAQLKEEQKAHAAIMDGLLEITQTQVRLTEALGRIEQRLK